MAENALVKQRWRRRWHLLFSWVLALVIGVPLCVSVLVPAIALRYNSELELSWKMVDGILLVAFSTVTWGGFILLLVTLIMMLPVLHIYRQKRLPVWLFVATALLGGVLAALGAVPRWYSMTFSQYELWASEEYIEWSTTWVILSFAGGAIFSGLLGGWIVFFDRRAGRSAGGAKISAGPNESEGGGNSRAYRKWVVYGTATMTLFLLVWTAVDFFKSDDEMTELVVRHQRGVLEDAQVLLREGAKNGTESYHRRHNSALKHFSMLGEVYYRPSRHYAGVVEIKSGSRRGLYVVPEPTSTTAAMLRQDVLKLSFGYVKVVNEHVYQYGSSLW